MSVSGDGDCMLYRQWRCWGRRRMAGGGGVLGTKLECSPATLLIRRFRLLHNPLCKTQPLSCQQMAPRQKNVRRECMHVQYCHKTSLTSSFFLVQYLGGNIPPSPIDETQHTWNTYSCMHTTPIHLYTHSHTCTHIIHTYKCTGSSLFICMCVCVYYMWSNSVILICQHLCRTGCDSCFQHDTLTGNRAEGNWWALSAEFYCSASSLLGYSMYICRWGKWS